MASDIWIIWSNFDSSSECFEAEYLNCLWFQVQNSTFKRTTEWLYLIKRSWLHIWTFSRPVNCKLFLFVISNLGKCFRKKEFCKWNTFYTHQTVKTSFCLINWNFISTVRFEDVERVWKIRRQRFISFQSEKILEMLRLMENSKEEKSWILYSLFQRKLTFHLIFLGKYRFCIYSSWIRHISNFGRSIRIHEEMELEKNELFYKFFLNCE